MAVYSQYNPATGQFEYFQGAPVQSSGDPSQWDWSRYGQADPRAYPDYWARPDGSLLADAVRMGNAWTAPRSAPPSYGSGQRYAFSPYDVAQGIRDQVAYFNYLDQPYYSQPASSDGGGGSWGGVGSDATMLDRAASAAQWLGSTGRRAAEAQDAAEDWIAGIQ